MTKSRWRPTARFISEHGFMHHDDFEKYRRARTPQLLGYKDGTVVQRTPVTHDKPKVTSVPLARGTALRSRAPTVNKWTEASQPERGTHERVLGEQFMGDVTTDSAGVGVGQRLDMLILSPEALHGRLEYLAQQYEFHKFHSVKLIYRTVVDATVPGALMVYFRNDVGTPTAAVGTTELEHAATHYGNNIQFPVWENQSCVFDLTSMFEAYSDASESGYLSAQGLITIESASALAGSTTFGNWYLVYDVEFYADEANYALDTDASDFTMTVTYQNYTTSVGDPYVIGFDTAAPVNDVAATIAPQPTDSNIILYGAVTAQSGTLPTYFVGNSGDESSVTIGKGYFISVESDGPGVDFTNRSLLGYFYVDYDSAGALAQTNAGGDASAEGVMRFSGSASYTGSFTMKLRYIRVKTE